MKIVDEQAIVQPPPPHSQEVSQSTSGAHGRTGYWKKILSYIRPPLPLPFPLSGSQSTNLSSSHRRSVVLFLIRPGRHRRRPFLGGKKHRYIVTWNQRHIVAVVFCCFKTAATLTTMMVTMAAASKRGHWDCHAPPTGGETDPKMNCCHTVHGG